MSKQKRASSKEVAKEAGVSQATVSYVLNNAKGIRIKPETREAVLSAAKKLNYHPNLIARSMRLQRSMSIGVVSDKNVSNFWFMKALEGIKDAMKDKNYSITLCLNKSQEIETAEHISYYSSNRIDGIIFAFAELSDEHIAYLLDNNIPFTVINSNVRNEMIRAVKTDMTQAMSDAVKHFTKEALTGYFTWAQVMETNGTGVFPNM
jgi:DNA-binding LacI/PurR family transcriptional regulator